MMPLTDLPAFVLSLAMFRFVTERAYEKMDFPAYAKQHEAALSRAIAGGLPVN
mgnify:CR=1 FL=1